MSSNDLISNLKYYGKFLVIIVVIFILLKFIMNLKIYESLLLALIITVSILIVENLIYINDIASDPLNCDQCKVNIGKINLDDNNINDALYFSIDGGTTYVTLMAGENIFVPGVFTSIKLDTNTNGTYYQIIVWS